MVEQVWEVLDLEKLNKFLSESSLYNMHYIFSRSEVPLKCILTIEFVSHKAFFSLMCYDILGNA